MAWIRLSDNYIDHPKFLALSATAFRLWHEGMAYCRKHQTDGLIPVSALQGFRYYKPVRATELASPYQVGAAPLWEPIPEFGFKVHDYLQWNPCKEDEQKRQADSKERSSQWRTNRVRAPHEPVRIGKELLQKEKETARATAGGDEPPVLVAYRAHWKHTYGHESSLIIKALDYMQLEQQDAKHGPQKLVAAVAAYFAADDAYARKARHPLALFLRDPVKYLATEIAPPSSAQRAAADADKHRAEDEVLRKLVQEDDARKAQTR